MQQPEVEPVKQASPLAAACNKTQGAFSKYIEKGNGRQQYQIVFHVPLLRRMNVGRGHTSKDVWHRHTGIASVEVPEIQWYAGDRFPFSLNYRNAPNLTPEAAARP